MDKFFRRPEGYKGYRPPLDLTRVVPRKVRAPKPIEPPGPPVDLCRRTPKAGQKVPFFDPEDITLATLAGPHSMRSLLLEGHEEILSIRKEVDKMIKRYLPNDWTPSQVDISACDCPDSPFGLCTYPKYDNQFRDCIFCKQLEN